MANEDRPNGFRPVAYLGGAPWNGKARKYVIPSGDSTAVFLGDLVKLSGTDAEDGFVAVTRATAAGAVIGAVVAVDPVRTDRTTLQGGGTFDLNLSQMYRPASTKMYVWVADEPDLVFEAQEDGIGGGLTAAQMGLNIDFVAGAGSTTTGTSGMVVDSSTANTTATLPLKLLGLAQRPGNAFETTGLAKVLVKINNHQLGAHTGTAGV